MSHKKYGYGLGLILLSLAIGAITLPVSGQKASTPKYTADLPPGAMQAKATTACTECHEARIIVQQRLSKDAWTKEVDKMTKWGALVDPGDRQGLIDYLSANFNPEQPPYEAPRSATQSAKAAR